jgi:hypothetical protein
MTQEVLTVACHKGCTRGRKECTRGRKGYAYGG